MPTIADVYRDAVAVGNHNLLDIFSAADHALRTDVISVFGFFDVAPSGVLVVFTQRLEYFTDGDVQ